MWTFGWSISIGTFPQADRTTTFGFHHRSLRSRTLRTNLRDRQEDFGATTPGWTSRKSRWGMGGGMKWCVFLLPVVFSKRRVKKWVGWWSLEFWRSYFGWQSSWNFMKHVSLMRGDFEFWGAEKFDNFVQMVSFTMVLWSWRCNFYYL